MDWRAWHTFVTRHRLPAIASRKRHQAQSQRRGVVADDWRVGAGREAGGKGVLPRSSLPIEKLNPININKNAEYLWPAKSPPLEGGPDAS